MRNPNDNDLWVHDRGKVCDRDELGCPMRVVDMVQNMTDRKKTELSLSYFTHCDALSLLLNPRQGDLKCERRLIWPSLNKCVD